MMRPCLTRTLVLSTTLLITAHAQRGAADVVAPPVSSTATSEYNQDYAVPLLFDGVVTDADVGSTSYGSGDGQWAGLGNGPFDVFMDFGTSLSGVDGLAYSQRPGGPAYDQVGQIELWFSNSDFGGAVPGTPADVSVSINNVANTILTPYSFHGDQFDGRYVAAKFSISSVNSGFNIGGSEFRLTTNTPLAFSPELTVDRDTGNLTLSNDTSDAVSFIAYQINSTTSGALDADQWQSIAQNYDAGSPGPNQVDSTHDWVEFTSAPLIGTLSEGQLPGGSGVTLASGKSVDLGNAWIRNPYEDIQIQLLQSDGSTLQTAIRYVGDEVVLGDLSNNGTVGPEDWPLFRAGLGSDGASMTLAQTYNQGDLDGDGDTDIADFRSFEAIYNTANGGGALAQLVGAVPEPTSLALLASCALAMTIRRSRPQLTFSSRLTRSCSLLPALCTFAIVLSLAHVSEAQVFTLSSPATPPTVTANSEFSAAYAVTNLFDDTTVTGADIGVKAYAEADPQYARSGPDPIEMFMDYGSSISMNYLAYAQRRGGIDISDKIGKIELWFANTDFGDTIPATPADAIVNPTDIEPNFLAYSLGQQFSGQYVAARMTIAPISLTQGTNNPGGNEWRFATGPSDLVLEVNRDTGSMTLLNEGSLAQDLGINGYEIRSSGGSLLSSWAGFENGSVAGFNAGNGSGNGWEKGDSADSNLLAEAYLQGNSELSINDVLSLGTGYNTGVDAMDLVFSVSIESGNGLLLPGRVNYVGGGGGIGGDLNNDQRVDGADFLAFQRGFPGTYNASDLANFQANYGVGVSGQASSSAVPEPATWVLSMLFAGVLAIVRFRRRIDIFALPRAAAIAGVLILGIVSNASAGTPDAIYLFGDNTDLGDENGAPGVEVGQGSGALIPGFTIDSYGDPTFTVPETFRDLTPTPDVSGQRPKYVNTASLGYPGTNLGAQTSVIGIQFDGVDDFLHGPGLGYPQQGDDNFTGAYQNAYQTLTTRLIDGWVRPTNLASSSRQDIVNDTYQFGIHITSEGTWGMNFGSDNGQVTTHDFDSGVSVASTLDGNGWAHVEQRTFNSTSAALYVNGEVVLLTAVGSPNYYGAPEAAVGTDLEITFGSNLTGDGNFFKGELDNFRLIVAGNNSAQSANGANYGDVDLTTDNDFITSHVMQGDANGDGVVNGDGTGPEASDDVSFFVNHFLDKQVLTDLNGNERVIGDIRSMTNMADFNGNGTTDIFDWYILSTHHEDSAVIASVNLGELLAGATVPEPATCLLGLVGFASLAFVRKKR